MSFFSIFKLTIPVLMGYVPTGIAFGLLAVNSLIPWYYAFFMSVFIYAGAGQFLAVTLFASQASLFEIAVATFLLNLRHSFYGISMISKFKNTKPIKPYLIFGMTDETFALIETIPKVDKEHKKRVYFLITLLNQSYWVLGSLIGAVAGKMIHINYDGIEFALNALFVVLAIELYKKYPNPKLLGLSVIVGFLGMVFLPSEYMLVSTLSIGLVLLIGLRGWIGGK